MADNNSITGSVVGKIRFNIDKKSWDNLNKFQSKLAEIKAVMSGMSTTMKVEVVTRAIGKITNATVKSVEKIDAVKEKVAKKERKRDTMNAHVQEHNYRKSIEKQHAEALRLDKKFNQQRQKAASSSVSKPSGKRGVDTMNSHVGLFYQNNRDHQQALKMNQQFDTARMREHQQALNMNEKFNRDKQRQAERIAREDAKFKARGGKFDEGVEAFRVVKKQQLISTAKMRGWDDQKLAAAQGALDKSITQWRTGANGSIGMFRAQVNTVIRDLQVTDAVARKSALSFRGLRQELVQLTAAYTAFSVAQNVAQTGFEFESLRASARVFAKDDAGVADHMAFISEQAQRLGIDLQTATKEFTKFSIATQSNMSKTDQRNLFVSMSEYSRVLGLNKQDYERAFRAVQQIECCLPIQ